MPRKPPRKTDDLILTTQPGWAFATLVELRSLGVTEHAQFHHRDSTLVVGAHRALLSGTLSTPAEVLGALAIAEASGRHDATERLRDGLRPQAIKRQVLGWLPKAQSRGLRRFSVTAEVYGRTAVHRIRLADTVAEVVGQAFPRWRRTPGEGLRILCKADARAAALGVQLYTTLDPADRRPRATPGEDLPGSLREHLACGLLALAGVGPGTAVLDPFMGTGTILAMARRRASVSSCVGLEINPQAYRMAARRLGEEGMTLVNGSFEEFDVSSVSAATALVCNVPFGVRFQRPPTDGLGRFLEGCLGRGASLTMLISREQAGELAPALGLRIKNVLVLGQPASILYHRPPQ